MGRTKSGPMDHAEELQELQRRFTNLNEQQKSSEASSASLMLASRRSEKGTRGTRSLRSLAAEGETGESFGDRNVGAQEDELRRLDEQIVSLRRKNDQLHEKNGKKRSELDTLADKLRDLHNTKFAPKETPEAKRRASIPARRFRARRTSR